MKNVNKDIFYFIWNYLVCSKSYFWRNRLHLQPFCFDHVEWHSVDGNFWIINRVIYFCLCNAVELDIFTISLSSSIFSSKLFIFKRIKCRPLLLKVFQFSFRWSFWIVSGFKLTSLKVEVLISDRERNFCDTWFDQGYFHCSNHRKF